MARRARSGRLLAWAEDVGKARGLLGSSSGWLAVWVLVTGYRRIKKLAAPEPTIIREVLQPGEQLIVSHYPKGHEPPPEPTKRQRKKQAKRERARTSASPGATD